jgi:CheY-like chemotaxis protein
MPRVLIADDSKTERAALGRLLAESGYEVETASDGHLAIELLKSVEVDGVVLDLHMPEHDGFEVLRYIREHRRGLPCVLLSGLPPNEIQNEMIRTGTAELPPLFQKPADIDLLLRVLGMLLSGELPPRAR